MKTLYPQMADSRSNIGAGFDFVLDRIGNMALTSGGLAIGTTSKAKVKVVTALNFSCLDLMYQIAAATEVAFTATTDDIVADADVAQVRKYLLVSDGTTTKLVAGVQGTAATAADPVESLIDGFTVLGRITLTVAVGATNFDATTDELDEAHITDVYENIAQYAPRFADILE